MWAYLVLLAKILLYFGGIGGMVILYHVEPTAWPNVKTNVLVLKSTFHFFQQFFLALFLF